MNATYPVPIEVREDRNSVRVRSPYTPTWPIRAKGIDGRWDGSLEPT